MKSLLSVVLFALVAAVSHAEDPCGEVLQRAAAAETAEAAVDSLAACLAARGPPRVHAEVAAELVRQHDALEDTPRMCRYVALLNVMLAGADGALDPAAAERLEDFAREQSCRCDLWHYRQVTAATTQDAEIPQRPSIPGEPERRLLHDSVFEVAGRRVEILVHQQWVTDHLCIAVDGRLRHIGSRATVSAGFESAEVFPRGSGEQVLAALVWRAGVHGEALQLVDLERGVAVLQKRSSWPLEYTIEDGRVHYTVYGDRIGDHEFEKIHGTY